MTVIIPLGATGLRRLVGLLQRKWQPQLNASAAVNVLNGCVTVFCLGCAFRDTSSQNLNLICVNHNAAGRPDRRPAITAYAYL